MSELEANIAKLSGHLARFAQTGVLNQIDGKPVPTLFTHATNDMRIAEEEIFSPVLTAIRFDREDEALAIANDVDYGLSGYVWTNNLTPAMRFTNKLEAGMIWVNSENVRHLPSPFGGIKASGIGRDGGDWSFEFYMEQKHIAFATGQHKIPQLGLNPA